MQGSRLYVGNLKYSVTEGQLQELFSTYGTVKDVTVLEGKGFGFVEMSASEEAEKAKEALLLAVINTAVHGVLFLDEKGTGKTTLVRSLSTLLPETQVIDLPLGCGD